MILFKLIFAIIKKVLLILAFVALLALVVTFVIAAVNNSGLEGGFAGSFFTELNSYYFGDVSNNQRMIGVILMIVGLLGGIVLSIIAIVLKKAGFLTLLFGLASIAGAIVTYPTLSGDALSAFFGGSFVVANYLVGFTFLASLTITIVGLYHVIYGLSARIG